MHYYKPKNVYLLTYGVISILLWAATLYFTIDEIFAIKSGSNRLGRYMIALQASQTLALFDIINSSTGIVSSQLLPTVIQVSSRLHIVWIVFYLSPQNSRQVSTVFKNIMIITWSLSELIRYPYYVVLQCSMSFPSIRMPLFLKWLRYSAFAVLYPIGILSEVVVCSNFISDIYNNSNSNDPIYQRLLHFPTKMPNAFNFEVNLACLYIVILCIYIPGSIFMYSYMIKQRKKSLINLWKLESDTKLE
ncbi:protein phosphatase [Cryptosporidium canis]|uniref:very-long-chain (3R)-3-hydroxyacyl-CoA dehydratase n=1 Tax=Cryptosporidium canis TaxID=195482 RepID=A0ABQ8P2W6_9CRYT|nr:protein phosphatase [Cryptosporidium canis]KAJ1614255.1 protein phosphatase [Cryptosporidium canis]